MTALYIPIERDVDRPGPPEARRPGGQSPDQSFLAWDNSEHLVIIPRPRALLRLLYLNQKQIMHHKAGRVWPTGR